MSESNVGNVSPGNVSGEQVRIFDTTLRDGEQAPGIALTKDEKVEIAEQLARLQGDIIEAGFAISSDGEFEAVREIASGLIAEDAMLKAADVHPTGTLIIRSAHG